MVSQAGNGACNFGVALLHQRNAAIDGGGDREVLIGNSPEHGGSDGDFGFGFIEAGDFAITVQHQGETIARAALAKILRHAPGAPERGYVGVGDEQNFFGEIADQSRCAIQARGSVHDNVMKQANHRIEQAGKVGGGRFDGGGRGRAGKHLQSTLVPGHEAIEQRRVEAMEIGDGVGDSERRLEVEMQRAVAEGRQVYQRGAVVNRLQGKREIDGYGGGAAAAFGIDDGENFSAGAFATGLAAHRGEANESFEEIGGAGGALDIFADTGAHGADNQLRLRHGADGEDGRIGEFLMEQFDGAERGGDGIGGDIYQEYVRREGLSLADDRVVGGQRQGGVAADGEGHAGAVN